MGEEGLYCVGYISLHAPFVFCFFLSTVFFSWSFSHVLAAFFTTEGKGSGSRRGQESYSIIDRWTKARISRWFFASFRLSYFALFSFWMKLPWTLSTFDFLLFSLFCFTFLTLSTASLVIPYSVFDISFFFLFVSGIFFPFFQSWFHSSSG